jgi:peptidoglycan/xylan/chitin deacetylase (PgdA/CDA1 family)
MKFKITLFIHIVILALGCLIIKDPNDLKFFVWLLSTVFLTIISFGVIVMRLNFFLTARCKTKEPHVLFTFDDGPHPMNTPKILDALNEHRVKAVFFIIGEKAMKHPEIIQRIVDEGHLIGNHTFSHPPLFALMPEKQVKTEITKCQDVLREQFRLTQTYFRPPIGYTNPIIARGVRDLNIPVMGWTFRSWDTVLKNPSTLLKRSKKGLKPGNILLFHDTLDQTARMLPQLLDASNNKGLNFADLQCIKNKSNG